jgi:hypothetical protein
MATSVRRVAITVAIAVGVVAAGGASVYTLRASGSPGCPSRKNLRNPTVEFTQAPRYYVTVTLTNPNDCYGFQDEAVEVTFFGPHGRRAISYFEYASGRGPIHGDVGICCRVTLPPHGTWTMRFGSRINDQGQSQLRICNIHFQVMGSQGYDAWKRMPAGGAFTGQPSFPPGWKDTAKPLTIDPTWRDACDAP